jgi:hypothetical protein
LNSTLVNENRDVTVCDDLFCVHPDGRGHRLPGGGPAGRL